MQRHIMAISQTVMCMMVEHCKPKHQLEVYKAMQTLNELPFQKFIEDCPEIMRVAFAPLDDAQREMIELIEEVRDMKGATVQ